MEEYNLDLLLKKPARRKENQSQNKKIKIRTEISKIQNRKQ